MKENDLRCRFGVYGDFAVLFCCCGENWYVIKFKYEN